MKITKWLKDKRVIYGGIGIAAVLGLYTLYARSKGGTGAGGDEDSASAGGSAGQLNGQFPDTSGTNMATWFGQYSESVQRQLDEYLREQRAALDALKDVPTSPTPTTTQRPTVARRADAFERIWRPPASTTAPVITVPGRRRT